ncbi:MAG: hypothetical protein A2X49_00980 [Lentisphaerae bacterium GWF2_52_8]|nr:MAG: hypothetical protein A2X49_00980 [Lentisphaerae bacterium GWF2_52_8]
MIVGGAQENTLLTILGHLEKGHEVVLLSGPSPGPEGELLKKRKLPVFEVVELPELERELSPLQDIVAYKKLKKFFSARSFDVVHTHSSKAGVLGRAAAWDARIPFVAHTVHGQAFHPYEKPWKNFIYKSAERWAAKRCHRIYAVAQAMIEQCVGAQIAAAEKYMLVYSGMELENFLNAKPEPELRDKLGLRPDSLVIGTVARLFPLKGYEDFMPAALQIAAKFPDVQFLIVGDGIMRSRLEQEALHLGLSKNFVFAGLVPPTEIHRYTALMDILAHLSVREGLPRAVVQALATGKPAIGYRLDGTPEVILDGKTGFLANPGDVAAVSNAALRLLNDPELRKKLGEAGQSLVSGRFDWRRMAGILEEDYIAHLSAAHKL